MPFQDQNRRGAALHRHRELFLSHLQRSGRRSFLASQLHELHPVFPKQVSNLFLKDSIKIMFPITPEAGFRHALRCVHGFLWSGSSREFYDRVSSGLRRNAPFFGCWLGNKTFDGFFVCLKKTAAGPKGFFSLCAVFGVSLARIIPYRGFQLGAFDTIVGLNPWKYDTGMFTLPPRLRRHRQPSFGRRYTQSCRESIWDSTRCLR